MILGLVISGFLEVVSTFPGFDDFEDFADGVANGLAGAFSGLAEEALELGEEQLDGVQVRRVFGQEDQLGASRSDSLADGLALVASEVVHDDDVAGLERWGEDLLDINPEPLAVYRPVEKPGCLDPVVAQRGQKRHGLPTTIRHLGLEPLAAWRPAPERRHVGFRPSLIDEDQAGRGNSVLILLPLAAPSRDVGTVLFAGEYGFF